MNTTVVARREWAASWRGPAISVAAILLTLLLAMAVYARLDAGIFDSLPEGLRNLMGVPAGADVETLTYSYVLDTLASLVLGAIGIAIGTRCVAGEEADGTLSLLLAAGTSRARVVVGKGLALATLVTLSGVAIWASAELSPVLLRIEKGEAMLAASLAHLTANALLHGFLALAVGAATGRRGAAVAVATAVMVLGWLLAGLLPLFEETAPLAAFVPWTWFSGHQPLLTGIDPGHLALQLGSVALLFAIAVLGLQRRDLRSGAGTSLRERVRGLPMVGRWGDRFTFSARSHHLVALLLSQRLALLTLLATGMFWVMGVGMGPLYAVMAQELAALSLSLPAELMAMMGAGDMSSAEGFYWAETMGLVAPVAVIVVGVAAASGGIAGAERDGQLSLVLAAPVPRFRVVASSAVAMVVHVGVVSVATVTGIWAGSALAGLGMAPRALAGAGVNLFLLGCVFGAVALLVAAATGRPAAALWTSAALAVMGHFLNAYLGLATATQAWAVLSPFHFYAAGEPLVNGTSGASAAVLGAVVAVLVAAAVPLFQRRDLRTP